MARSDDSTDELVTYSQKLVGIGDISVDGSLLTARGVVVGVKSDSTTAELDVLQGTTVVIVVSRSVVRVLCAVRGQSVTEAGQRVIVSTIVDTRVAVVSVM
jgi:hypothetical protein